MSEIAGMDRNMIVQAQIDQEGIVFHDINLPPFHIHGLTYTDGRYRRMPESVAKTVSERVLVHHDRSAGGRVRFKTDSDFVAIHAVLPSAWRMPQITVTGTCGFDLYVRENGEDVFEKAFIPPFDVKNGYESIHHFPDRRMRELTIHFPLYSAVGSLHIGLREGAVIEEPTPYAQKIPMVFYGSSITMGGCANRPGNNYENILSRWLDADHLNLGFAGCAMGEPEMAAYISTLPMSLFVLDYDHNAPTVEHLQATHEPFFQTIRKANPQLPIVILSRPKVRLTQEDTQRLAVIRRTYENAKAAGDSHVYMIEGSELMRLCGDEGTVEGCHPTDFGFYSIATALRPLLQNLLQAENEEK